MLCVFCTWFQAVWKQVLNNKEFISLKLSRKRDSQSHYLKLPGRGIAEVKHFTQPCGVTDKDRCWKLIKTSFACPVLNHIKYLLLQKSSQDVSACQLCLPTGTADPTGFHKDWTVSPVTRHQWLW